MGIVVVVSTNDMLYRSVMGVDQAVKSRVGLAGRWRSNIACIVLGAVLWLQGNVLWHDTAHAAHDHGPELMCTLDVLLPEFGVSQHHAAGLADDHSMVVGLALKPCRVKAALIPAYFCRAPPHSSGCIHR